MADEEAPFPDPRDEEFYARYLETCRLTGVEPVSRQKARQLVAEWNEAITQCAR
jgi:hypothetical protein